MLSGRSHRIADRPEETPDIGLDTGTPIDMSYDIPFKFTVELGKVVINLK